MKAWRLPLVAGLGALSVAMLFLVADSSTIEARILRVIQTSSTVATPFVVLYTGIDPTAGSVVPVDTSDQGYAKP
ncbi:MAG: hypothetical protein ACK50Q_11760 [Labrys sp. (in: a-proteobacteria)]